MPQWPLGNGEMAQLIRQHDWAATPLGPIEAWPQSLKTIMDLMLHSPSMMSLVWGPEAIHLYNDAFTELLQEHRIRSLGRSAFETFARSRDVFAGDLANGMAGHSARLLGQRYPVLRNGHLEDGWFDVDYAPAHDEAGEVGGVLWSLREVTPQVKAGLKLRESEARLAAAFESIPAGIAAVDGEGRTVIANAEYRNYLPTGVIPSRDPDRGSRWRGWNAQGERLHPTDFPGARALRGERVIPGQEMLYTDDDGRENWMNVATAPTFDGAGRVTGAVTVISDINERKRSADALRESEVRQAFLLKLSDALRPLADPVEIQEVATRVLGEHLKANRVAYTQVTENEYIIEGDYVNDVPSMAGRHAIASFGPNKLAAYREGQTRVVRDTASDTFNDPVAIANFEAIGVRAGIGVPLFKNGRIVATLVVHQSEPRDWTGDEVALAEETAERTWAAHERAIAEAALRRSEEKYRSLFQNLGQGYAECELIRGADGRVTDFRYIVLNPAFERLSGLKIAGMIGRTAREAVPDIEDSHFEMYERIVEDGVPVRREYEVPALGRWYENHVYPSAGDRFFALYEDITERKRGEAALRESEERLRQFGEASQDVLWIRDAETLSWEYLTPAFETIYGLSRAEALSGNNFRNWIELVVPEDREYALGMIRRVRAGERVAFEYRISRPVDGQLRWLRNTDFPIYDGEGRIVRIGGIGQDITHEKQSQQQLALSEERLRTASEVGRLGLWDWNTETGEVHWSAEHFRMQGYEVGEITPSYGAWASRIHPDDREGAEAALRHAMDARKEYVREFRVVHPDGSVHWLYGRGRFFYGNDGEPLRMIGAMMETTERREAEGRMAVLVAELQHRTRNLMGVVRSTADRTMQRSTDLASFKSAFRDRLAALARVQGLLSRLNDWDRISFDELIGAEMAVLDGEADQVALEGPSGILLRSSTVQTLAMALHELATNALKYGALKQRAGRLSIRWSLVARGEGGVPWLHVDWRERGVVMPPSDAPAQGSGMGRELIERALPHQFGAKTTFVMEKDGVHCRIALPVSERTLSKEAAHA